MIDEIERVECTSCALGMDLEDAIRTDGDGYVCADCVRICERCDLVGTDCDDFTIVDGNDWWCSLCTRDGTNWCDDCETNHSGDSYSVEDTRENFCENCISNTYYCDDCGCNYQDGCPDHRQDNERVIHDYSYRPDAIFHSTNNDARLYFGMEIEVEAQGGSYSTRDTAANFAQGALEPQEIAYLKSDGSLNCGFEIVTHPMTHDYFHNEVPEFWDTLSQLRDNYNLKSWATRTCGLHIHISRTGFSTGSHLHRFLRLVYDNQALYEKLAGRSSEQWAKFTDNRTYDGKKSYYGKVNNGAYSDRYSAVNCQNRATVEMRIFRGSLNGNFVKASLDLAHASVEYTRVMTAKQVMEGSLNESNFVEYIKENAILYSALNERISRVLTLTDATE